MRNSKRRCVLPPIVLPLIFVACAPPTAGFAQLSTIVAYNAAEEAAFTRISTALAKPISTGLPAGPLSKMVAHLQRELNVPFRIDQRALEDLGLSPEVTVEAIPVGVSAESALRMVLDPLDMVFLVRGEMVQITSQDQAEYNLLIRIYDVTRIADRRDVDDLLNAISSTIKPESWDEVGGPGTLQPTRVGGRTLLVISQTDDTHRLIERLLLHVHRVAAVSSPTASAIGRDSLARGDSTIRSSTTIRRSNY